VASLPYEAIYPLLLCIRANCTQAQVIPEEMKWLEFIRWIVLFTGLSVFAQPPTVAITPGANMTVCAGTTVAASAAVSNAFAGTTSYGVSAIGFSPYAMPGGTNVTLVDDTIKGPYPIGFQFCYYGNTYTQFYIGSNGWVGFSPGMTRAFTANSIPNTTAFVPRNCIMGPWMDFHPGFAGGPYVKYQTQGIAPYRRLVVQWLNCPLYQCTGAKATFQIVLFESTNVIENHITAKPVCMSWAGGTATQGLHNSTGTLATPVPGRNAAVWNVTNDATRFTPSGPPSFTINWTANGFPIGTGTTISTTVAGPGPTRLIARVNFQCSNLIIYDTLDISVGGSASAAFSVPPVVCAGQPANFTYTGGAAGTGAWTFGSGTPATGTTLPTQASSWATPGVYPVTLVVTPSSGACTPGTVTQNVTVTAPPTSTFNLPASLCVNTNGSITYSGAAPAGSTYAWNFGAGATPATAATTGPHSVAWSSNGSKTISLTVTSGTCSSTTSNTITISAAPTATFTISPSPVCASANSTVTFTGTAAAGATYTWNFGANASPATASTAGPHTVNWSVAGTKTITCTVSAGGCSATSSQSLIVNPIPTAAFTLPGSACIGANASVVYSGTAPAPPAATYTWNVGGGSPTPGNTQGPANVSWATSGSKTVTLTVAQNGCSSLPVSHTINITPAPVVTIAPSLTTSCAGQTITVGTTGTAPPVGTTYAWSFGPGSTPATSTSAGPVSVSWSTPGTSTASLIITSGGCSSAPATTNVTVTTPPSSAITAPLTGCLNVGNTISAAGPFPVGTTFAWNFGTGTIISGSGAGPYSVSWGSSGNQTISLTVTSGNCVSTSTKIIDIKSAAVAGFAVPQNLCINQAGLIEFTGTAPTGSVFNWNFGAGASPATANIEGPHNITYSTNGLKTISLSVSFGGCPASIMSQNLTVNPVYTSTFTMPPTICRSAPATLTYTGNAPAGSTYSWNFGAGATPATANSAGPQSVSWATAGISTVSLTVTNGICSSTTTQNITVNQVPTATFTVPASTCLGSAASIAYTGNATAGATYSWTFPSSSTPTQTGAGPYSVTWATAGSYNAGLTVTQNGCSSPVNTVPVTVQAIPTTTFTLAASLCANQTTPVSYSGNATAGATITWNFGAGSTPATAAGAGPHNVSWSTPGAKTVSVTVVQNGCSGSSTQNITINTAPSAAFTLTNPECINDPVIATYTGGAPGSASFTWNYPGATLISGSGSGPLQLSYAAAGSQSVSLTVSQNSCASALVTQTTVINAPPSFTIASPAFAGINTPVAVTYSGTQPAGATYTWNFNGGTVVSGAGAGPYQIQWPTLGIKTISCTVTVNGCNPVTQTSQTEVVSAAIMAFTAESPLCTDVNGTVQFTGFALPSATYAWDFAGGTIISGSGPGPFEISWPTAGAKNVTLQVTQLGIPSSLMTQVVQVNAIPVAAFILPAFLCEDNNLTIQPGGSFAAGATYSWNFGSGQTPSTSTTASNTVLFPDAGTVPVSFTVTENGCTSLPVSHSVEVRQNPVASFTSNATVCEGEPATVTFNGTAGPGSTYSWNFNGGTIVSGSGAGPYQVSWNVPGTMQVSLQVTQNQCSSTTFDATVIVKPQPVAAFSIVSDSCAGVPVQIDFTGTAGASATYTWDFGTGTIESGSNAGPYSVSFPGSGSFPVSLFVTENGCTSETALENASLNQQAVNTFTLTDTTYVNLVAEAEFTGTALAGTSFTWDYPGATWVSGTAGGPIELTWPAIGNYNVNLELNNNGCIASLVSHSIVVLDLPAADFSLENDTLCEGSAMLITYDGSATSEAIFNWDFDGGTIVSGSGAGPYQVSWSSAGAKNITLYLQIGAINTPTSQEEVFVIEVPTADFTIPAEVCAGASITANYTNTTGINSLFQWTFDNANSITGDNTGTPSVAWDTAGIKTVTLSVADAMCISPLVTRTVNVKPFPMAVITLEDFACKSAPTDISFSGTAGSSATYTWTFDGGSINSGSAQGPFSIEWNTSGPKHVILNITENGCIAPAADSIITVRELPNADAGETALLCSGDSIQLNANVNPDYSYRWFPSGGLSNESISNPMLSASTIHSYVETQVYSVETNDGFCLNTDSVIINVAPMPEAFFSHPVPQCLNGNSFDFNADGSFTQDASFNWNFGSHGFTHSPGDQNQADVTFDATGNQPVTLIISQYGCNSAPYTDSALVNAHPAADFTAHNTKGCVPLEASFEGQSTSGIHTTSFNWSFGDGGQSSGQAPSHNYTVSGYFNVSLTVTDSNGCTASHSQQNYVQVLEQPIAGFRLDPELIFIGQDELDIVSLSENALYSYYVIEGDTILGATNTYNFTQEGEFPITQVVVNGAGCTDEITHTIRVEYGTEYYIPRAFSPNNDGHNDVFKVVGSEIKEFTLLIFNRWGQIVFESNNINNGWEGMAFDNTVPMPEGVYIFRLEMKNKENRDIVENGSITLLR